MNGEVSTWVSHLHCVQWSTCTEPGPDSANLSHNLKMPLGQFVKKKKKFWQPSIKLLRSVMNRLGVGLQ